MKNYKSILAIVTVVVIYFISVCVYKPYDDLYMHQEGDALGYYIYLPSFFIHHDLPDMQKSLDARFRHCAPGRKAVPHSVNKYFMGTAVLQAPFFLLAHALAGPLGFERDGYSMIYIYLVQSSCDVYVLLAFFIIMLILRRRFSDTVSAIVILIIGLGTNLYYLCVYHAPFSHPYLFFWYALLILFTIRFYESLQRRYILLIGFVCGMITLTRLTEFYALLIPLLWGIRSGSDIAERLKLLRRLALPVIAGGVIMILCLLPQGLYWKIACGQFFYYSYTGEKFDFLHPHIIYGLFSGLNGWLIYSPVMLLALIGIGLAARRRDDSFVPLVIFLSVHVYVIYSWWCWFYMGSYGSRPMTEAYPLLAIPLAYMVDWLWQSWSKKIVLILIMAFCIFQVMFQTYQTDIGIFNSEVSNLRYDLISFGKTQLSYEESVVLNTDEFQPHHPALIKVLEGNDFEDAGIEGSDTSVFRSGRRSMRLGLNKYSPGYTVSLTDAGARPGQWVRASIDCLAKEKTDDVWHQSKLVIAYMRGEKLIKWKEVSLQNKIDNPRGVIRHFAVNKWGRVYFYSQIPKDMIESDKILVYVYHANDGSDIYIDDLKVELYDEK
jgi:4-amino-4-deoxy-L-arabinose transferase-like glycosyltransferase